MPLKKLILEIDYGVSTNIFSQQNPMFLRQLLQRDPPSLPTAAEANKTAHEVENANIVKLEYKRMQDRNNELVKLKREMAKQTRTEKTSCDVSYVEYFDDYHGDRYVGTNYPNLVTTSGQMDVMLSKELDALGYCIGKNEFSFGTTVAVRWDDECIQSRTRGETPK